MCLRSEIRRRRRVPAQRRAVGRRPGYGLVMMSMCPHCVGRSIWTLALPSISPRFAKSGRWTEALAPSKSDSARCLHDSAADPNPESPIQTVLLKTVSSNCLAIWDQRSSGKREIIQTRTETVYVEALCCFSGCKFNYGVNKHCYCCIGLVSGLLKQN